MPRASPIQSSFNAGEFSPLMDGRVDLEKYGSACKTLDNFIPAIQGPAVHRGGFRFVGEVKDSSDRTWLVRFEFDATDAYQFEFGDGYIRFWKDRTRLELGAQPAWSALTNYVVGDTVASGGITYYCIAAHINQVPPNASFWYPIVGLTYEIPSPYSAANLIDSKGLFNLRFVQSADVVYICSPFYAPMKLSRFANTRWTLTKLVPTGGPFAPENITATTVYASAASGSVTLTASTSIFQPGHVGSLFYLGQKSVVSVPQWEAGKVIAIGNERRSNGVNYKALTAGTTGGNRPVHSSGAIFDGDPGVQWQYNDPGYSALLITAYTSGTVVTASVVAMSSSPNTPLVPSNAVGAPNASTRWAYGAWSDVDGWPTQVAFFRERLCFARGTSIWLSVAGDYEVFNTRDDVGLVVADSAISATLLSQQVNDVQWIEPLNSSTEALVAGTAGSEFVIRSQTENEPFGPANSTAAIVSTLGSRNIRPVHVNSTLLFVQKAGSKIQDVSFEFTQNGYQSIEESILAEHLTKPSINQIVYQREPYSLIWAARSDGNIVCMTYSREQYRDAPHGGWHRHNIGGDGFVECLSVIPSPDGTRDDLWAIIRYTINGATKRYVAYMEAEYQQNDDPENSFYVDIGMSRTSSVNDTLLVPIGADVDGATGLIFETGVSEFAPADVGRKLFYRYSTADTDGNIVWATGKARITSQIDGRHVACVIENPFPNPGATIPANGWALTQNVFSGFSHLEGQTIDVLVDGATHPQCLVSGGLITLQLQAAKVIGGLYKRARLQTMRFNAGGADGTSQGKLARIEKCVVRMFNTLGLRFGASFEDMQDIDFRSASDLTDQAPPMFTGDKVLDFTDTYDNEPWVCLEQPYPLPCTVVAIMPQVTTYDRS